MSLKSFSTPFIHLIFCLPFFLFPFRFYMHYSFDIPTEYPTSYYRDTRV
jgi:hypothetical protein